MDKKNKVENSCLWRMKAAFAVNILIVALEVVGLIISAISMGTGMFVFYTQDSNIFSLVTSSIFVVFVWLELKKGKEIPAWVGNIKYMSNCCLALTFSVVAFVFVPMTGIDGIPSLFLQGSALFYHFLCPVISVISFFAFERYAKITKKRVLAAMIPTVAYAIISVILNVLKVIVGPYPFLRVYEQPVIVSVIWGLAILLIAFIFACLFYVGKNFSKAKK